MIALQAACESGVAGVEFDVQFSKDGHLVIFHDRDGYRILGDPRGMADYTLEEIKGLDVGRWRGREDHIPTFHEVMSMVNCSKILEIKPQWRELENNFALEQAVLNHLDDYGSSLGLGYISVRSVESLEYIRDHSKYPVGLMQKKRSWGEFQGLVEEYGIRFSQIRIRSFPKEKIPGLIDKTKVVVYYADTPDEWQQLFDLGVYGILTNRPYPAASWKNLR